jgi:hypothetical protein
MIQLEDDLKCFDRHVNASRHPLGLIAISTDSRPSICATVVERHLLSKFS